MGCPFENTHYSPDPVVLFLFPAGPLRSFPPPAGSDKLKARTDARPSDLRPGDAMSRMMQQYHDAKAAHPGMIVLFRNGDFYELFEDDAELGSKVLGITLTKRDGTIPMAGVPVHKLEHYLALLLRAGHRVAVCEQMEEPDPKKKIIHREVNRVVTPGTVTDDVLLDPRAPNHLVAVAPGPKPGTFGLAWADLSTGAFAATDVPAARLADEL
jgi:DNA mismatch repair protein MutS